MDKEALYQEGLKLAQQKGYIENSVWALQKVVFK